ncbi:hypothetical protein E8E11_009963 [Didymella keratinophila]|nr:hypothetical protein E8E11_009963 [Didymella keratinophila]
MTTASAQQLNRNQPGNRNQKKLTCHSCSSIHQGQSVINACNNTLRGGRNSGILQIGHRSPPGAAVISSMYGLPKGLLAHYSEYFARAFGNPVWAEASGVVKLEENGPDMVQFFQNFIYTGRWTDNVRLTPHIGYVTKRDAKPLQLFVDEKGTDEASLEIKTRDDAVPLSFEMLLELVEFAHMRIVHTLTDTVVTLIGRKVPSESYIPVSLICSATEIVPLRHRLGIFLFELILTSVSRDNLNAYSATLPQHFLAVMAGGQLDLFDKTSNSARTGLKKENTEILMCSLHDERCAGILLNDGRDE